MISVYSRNEIQSTVAVHFESTVAKLPSTVVLNVDLQSQQISIRSRNNFQSTVAIISIYSRSTFWISIYSRNKFRSTVAINFDLQSQ